MIAHHNTILWAEDESFHMGLVRGVIKESYKDFYLAEASNGREALRFLDDALLLHVLPKIIVLDINMPDMDGRKTLINLIMRQQLNGIPKVLFSSSCSLLDKLFCKRYSVPLVYKPASEKDCKKAIISILDTYFGKKTNN